MPDPVLFLQVSMANLYRSTHGLTVEAFNALDRKYDILRYIEIAYEPFHLTGAQGVLEEIEKYIAKKEREALHVSGHQH